MIESQGDQSNSWQHGQELTYDQAVEHLNATKIVSVIRTPVSLDFRQEDGTTIAFYVDGPERGKVKYERWNSRVEDELHGIAQRLGGRDVA